MGVHDYICTRCWEAFAVTDPVDDEPVPCPACGSELVRETWESRVRHARTREPSPSIEEMRGAVG